MRLVRPVAVGFALVALTSSAPTPAPTPTPAPSTVAGWTRLGGQVQAALAGLPVKGRAPMTGYSRRQFGGGWRDPDGNDCNARQDVLVRQAVAGTEQRTGAHHCVTSAIIVDPYSGAQVPSTGADIDHVVAEGDAWQTGAQQLTLAQRTALANDPLELIATSGHLNRAKGDADAASWLPPLKLYRCGYVARQIAVKRKYRLWITTAERDAMNRVLSGCPAQTLPKGWN